MIYLVPVLIDADRRLQSDVPSDSCLQAVSLPMTSSGLPAYYLLALAEASSNMARYDGMHYGRRDGTAATSHTVKDLITRSRGASLGPEVKRRVRHLQHFFPSGTIYHALLSAVPPHIARRVMCST